MVGVFAYGVSSCQSVSQLDIIISSTHADGYIVQVYSIATCAGREVGTARFRAK